MQYHPVRDVHVLPLFCTRFDALVDRYFPRSCIHSDFNVNESPFAVAAEQADGVIRLLVSGIADPTLFVRINTVVNEYRKPSLVCRLFVDVRDLRCSISILDIEDMLMRLVSERLHLNLKVALLYTSTSDRNNNKFRFAEMTAMLNGIQLKTFTVQEDALRWLKR